MYRWKSWHDSRSRLTLYAGACAAIGLLIGLDSFFTYLYLLQWQAVFSHARFRGWNIRLSTLDMTVGWILQILPNATLWCAFVLGATSVGREYGSGAMPFVLTRPQLRKRIIWDDWTLGIAEICIIVFMLFVGALPFLAYTSGEYLGRSGLRLPGILAIAACLFGLVQFLTLLTGSSMKGSSAAVAVILFYSFLPSALDEWWHIKWPLQIKDLSLSVFDWNWDEFSRAAWEITILWVLVALIFPMLSQWVIERREV